MTMNKARRRLLMVQSAGFGTYAQLLELTAPLNKAYARKWGHSFLVLQGSVVSLAEERRRHCTPPEHRSTHNKMQLLKFGIALKDHYDYLLILDADAMIYDWDRDVSDLMPPTHLLAANRVVAKKGVKKRATWKINAGVTLWNLHHPYAADLADAWVHAAVGFMNGRSNNQGDQLFLYHVLKNNASMEEQVYAFNREFNYNKATVIKHVKRPALTYEIGETALEARAHVIQQFTKEICDKFPVDCHHLDQTKYSNV
jgi:predicted phosphatase